MPGPFPGMDPYLEAPSVWRNVHNRLITYISDELNILLPEGYVATSDERVYVVPWDDFIYPDVALLTTSGRRTNAGSSTAVLAASDEPYHLDLLGDERHKETFIEVKSI